MRFLIVNGYELNRVGSAKFEVFRQMVIEIIKRQKELIDTENEFYIRDKESVEDFLYEQENSHIKQESGKHYDQIDIIYIFGNNNAHPWSTGMNKILTLIKMCLKTHKLLYCGAFGTQALAYLCASNLTTNIKITNNNGNGSKLSEFSKYANNNQKSDEYFLDSTTGDIYTYSYESDEWIPKFNAGIHNRRDAMEYQSIGKYIVKSPTYKPKESSQALTLCLDTKETVIRVKKNYYHHWAFQDINPQFVVKNENYWDIHTFSFINPERKFTVLAECNHHGPMIIECKNTLACMFDPIYRYKDTVQVLENFTSNALRHVKQSTNYNSISIVNDRFFQQQNGLMQTIEIVHSNIHKISVNGNPEMILKSQQRNFLLEMKKYDGQTTHDEPIGDPLFHVGYSVKKSRLPDFVSQNLMSHKKLKILGTLQTSNSRNVIRGEKNTLNKRMLTNLITSCTPTHSFKTETLPNEEKLKVLTQQDVRQALHPDLDRSLMGSKKLWVPGEYSKNKSRGHNLTRSVQTSQLKRKISQSKYLDIYPLIDGQSSMSPMNVWNHKFRENQPKKWLLNKDFLV